MFPPIKHGPLSPSRLHRIIECPGSYTLASIYESKQSSYAAEGEMLHDCVEQVLLTKSEVSTTMVDPPLNDEQYAAVSDCVDYYYNTLKTITGAITYFEAQVFLKEYDPCLFDCYGTADIIIKNQHELHVMDWKFGKGVPVYAAGNDQLYAYALGAAENKESLLNYKQIYIHCIQPRLDSFDFIILSPKELLAWLNARLIPGIRRAIEGNAPFNPGIEQCRWCPAKNVCRARFNYANQTAAEIFREAAKAPDEIDIDSIAKLVAKGQLLESILSDYRLYIQRKLEQGESVSGWKLVHGRSIRQWSNATVAERWLLDQGADFDSMYESKFVSPAQAEKRFKQFKKDTAFQALIVKPEGKPTLVPESDKRQPIEFKTAAEKFKEALDE